MLKSWDNTIVLFDKVFNCFRFIALAGINSKQRLLFIMTSLNAASRVNNITGIFHRCTEWLTGFAVKCAYIKKVGKYFRVRSMASIPLVWSSGTYNERRDCCLSGSRHLRSQLVQRVTSFDSHKRASPLVNVVPFSILREANNVLSASAIACSGRHPDDHTRRAL